MAKKTFDEDGNAMGDDLDIVAQAPQPTEQPATDSDSDSDDEAPEAVSTKTARSSVLEEEKAKRDLAARAAALEKEKRRLRDQKLKEQKQSSKRQKKSKSVELVKAEEEAEKNDEEEEEKEKEKEKESENNTPCDTRLLPADLLAQAVAEENSGSSNSQRKRTHLTAADFDRMEAEAAAEEAKNANKKRKVNERRVGEYTVKVINNRPRPAPTDKKILNFKERSVQRKAIPRKDALLQKSQRKNNVGNAALQFHRK